MSDWREAVPNLEETGSLSFQSFSRVQSKVRTHSVAWVGVLLHKCFLDAEFRHSNVSDSFFDQVVMREAVFANCHLHNVSIMASNVEGAVFVHCSFNRVSFSNSNLRGASFAGMDLRGCTFNECALSGATFTGARLPSPQVMLAANWGECSPELTLELMRYDCASLPNGEELFDEWAATGMCPYAEAHVSRAAHFWACSSLWKPGPSLPPHELLDMVLREKSVGWE